MSSRRSTSLGDWLGRAGPLTPILPRRAGGSVVRPSVAGASASSETNPFIRIADEQGYKQPIDVDARLAVMRFHGAGEDGVHATQLQVSAALIERGHTVDDIVTRLLEATRQLAGTEKWNWQREHRKLHSMCLSWLAKHPQPAAEEPQEAPAEPAAAELPMNLPRAPKPKSKEAHVVLAKGVLAALEARGEQLLVTPTGAYWYTDALWRLQDDRELRLRLNREISLGARSLGLVTTNRLVNEAREWILREPEVFRPDVRFNAHGKVPVINGLIDPRTGVLVPPAPEHYATWRIEHAYAHNAKCPHWLQTLSDAMSNRPDEEQQLYMQLVQEVLGASLIDNRPKSLSCALVMIGAPDTGKTVLLDVMGGLHGGAPNTTKFSELEGNHGLMPFLARAPWVLHEAFSGKWYPSDVVKSIITGDPININRKNAAILSHRYQGGIFWASNHPVSFNERTRAIVERMVIIEMQQQFARDSSQGAAAIAGERGLKLQDFILEDEAAGVLAWAIEGLARCLKRGKFVVPHASIALAEDTQRDTNWAADFVSDCIDYDIDSMVSTSDLYVAFCAYDRANRSTEPPDPRAFGLAIKALNDQRIAIDRERFRRAVYRYYGGIALNDAGQELRKEEVKSKYFENRGKVAGVTAAEENPNKTFPSVWRDSASYLRAKTAQKFRPQNGADHGPDQMKNTLDKAGHGITKPLPGHRTGHSSGHPPEVPGARRKPLF